MGRLCGAWWQGPRERRALDDPAQCLLALCDLRFLPLLNSVHAGGTDYRALRALRDTPDVGGPRAIQEMVHSTRCCRTGSYCVCARGEICGERGGGVRLRLTADSTLSARRLPHWRSCKVNTARAHAKSRSLSPLGMNSQQNDLSRLHHHHCDRFGRTSLHFQQPQECDWLGHVARGAVTAISGQYEPPGKDFALLPSEWLRSRRTEIQHPSAWCSITWWMVSRSVARSACRESWNNKECSTCLHTLFQAIPEPNFYLLEMLHTRSNCLIRLRRLRKL